MIIYKATNTVNGKVYVGLTSMGLKKRKTKHLYEAKKKAYNSAFHAAIRKNGVSKFLWEVIDKSDSMDDLYKKESYWISFFNSYKDGYNLTKGGEGNLGYKYTDEDKMKVSLANRGENSSSATIDENTATRIVFLLINTKLSYSEISNETNANTSIIKQINHGQSWKHLYESKPILQNPFKRPTCKSKIDEDLDKLKSLLKTDLTLRKIAEEMGVSHPTIIQAMRRNGLERKKVS
jgi:group I intron endonuclease